VALHGVAKPGAPGAAAPAPGGSASAAPATTPGAAAAIAVPPTAPTATPEIATAYGPALHDLAPLPSATGHTTVQAAPASTTAEQHNLLVGAVLTALANDGGVLRALLTAVMMVLPFAVIAGLAAMGRVLWRRRRHAETPPTD
jgi:hypothetical protein